MKIGGWNVLAVCESTFALDGGTMFGITPRTVWASYQEPDEYNRITLTARSLLLIGDERRILIDCGIGERLTDTQRALYQQKALPVGLVKALARCHVGVESITDVIATHLHFDHVGGLFQPDPSGRVLPTFPQATVHVQQEALDWARNPSIFDEDSFLPDDLACFEDYLRLQLLTGDCEIAPGVRVQATAGHTPGHQIVIIGQGSRALVFCADLIPTAAHIHLPHIAAYDHRPVQTVDEKKLLLAQALEENWILVFEHDPKMAACALAERDGRVVPGRPICLNVPG